MINFNEPGKTKNLIKITKAPELMKDLNYIAEKSSRETARTKLNDFKHLMKDIGENPYLSDPVMESLKIPKDLEHICCKMKNFLMTPGYLRLSYNLPSKSASIDNINYEYDIPILCVPVIVAFIASILGTKISHPVVSSFFKHMDNYLQKYPFEKILMEEYPQYSREMLLNSYQEWMKMVLGRDYFIHLEELYDICASNENQRKQLKLATCHLTQLATFPNSNCTATIEQLDGLLQDYTTALKQKAKNVSETNPDYSSLFQPQYKVFPLSAEKKCIDDACKTLDNLLNQLKNEIKEYFLKNHKSGSMYLLAVQDINDFEYKKNSWCELIGTTRHKIVDILSYYDPNPLFHQIMTFDLYDTVIIKEENIIYKRQKLFEIFSDTFSDTEKVLDQLLKYVKKASGKNPENYSAKTTEHIMKLKTLNEISEIQKKTIKQIDDNNFPDKYPSLYRYSQEPYVVEMASLYLNPEKFTSKID